MDPPTPSTVMPAESVLSLCVDDGLGGRAKWVPLRFVGAPGAPYVLAREDEAPAWVQRIGRHPSVRWRVGEAEHAGIARRVATADPQYQQVRDSFVSRFGAARLADWFGERALCVQLQGLLTDDPPGPAAVEALFDASAADYDRLVLENPMDRWLREESVAFLADAFRGSRRVLELGCGTGLETIPLAEAGLDVVAVDVSRAMLDHLEDKVHRRGLESQVHARKLPASGLEPLLSEFGPASFDGAFSDFGALNLDPRWTKVPALLGDLIRPGGTLVLGIWNRVCLMEIALYAMALRPSRALSRLQSPVPPGLSRFPVPVMAYAPRAFLSAFEPGFELESLVGLPVLVPPYDFLPHIPSPERILPLLESADRRVRRFFPFNRLGDHFLVRLRRTGA